MARQHLIAAFSALALIATAGLLAAGPLDPPVGPVAPTAKPLVEVEPRIAINATNTPGDADSLFKITTRGSYYLTGNITGVVGKHGIEIAASNVTLDLNGFDLVGIATGAFDGVSATVTDQRNIAVVNGSVRNWGQNGINCSGATEVTGGRVEGVRASGNVRTGVNVGTMFAIVRCSSTGGQYGIFSSTGCTITDCSASNSSLAGITTGGGSTLSNCTVYGNTGVGIATGTGCTVSNCSTNFNTGDGIDVSSGCTVSNCSAYSNTGSGIDVSSSCTVADCTVMGNALDGIQCSSYCVIRGNACDINGNGAGSGAGIHAFSGGNRIEGNTCSNADRGIYVQASGNIIIKNSCRGNTINWDFAVGNAYGPIVDTPAGNAVNGNTAAASLGSTDPNANFTY